MDADGDGLILGYDGTWLLLEVVIDEGVDVDVDGGEGEGEGVFMILVAVLVDRGTGIGTAMLGTDALFSNIFFFILS